MIRHPILQELLEMPAIRAIANEMNKRREVPIYRLQIPNAEELRKEAYRWAYSLFLNAENGNVRPEPIEHQNRLVLQYPGGYRIRTYYASGYLEYRDMERTYSGKTEVIDLSDADALVTDFAAKHTLWSPDSDRQLRPEGIRFVKSQGRTLKGETTDTVINNSVVFYRRFTEGIPWVGPGSRVMAMIEGRDVVGFSQYKRIVIPDPIGVVSLMPIEAAIEGMVDNLSSRLDGSSIEPSDILLERADFGYYAEGKRKLQHFLQPAYVFIYCIADKFTTIGFVDVQLAHEKQLERLGYAPSEAAVQLRRSELKQEPRE